MLSFTFGWAVCSIVLFPLVYTDTLINPHDEALDNVLMYGDETYSKANSQDKGRPQHNVVEIDSSREMQENTNEGINDSAPVIHCNEKDSGEAQSQTDSEPGDICSVFDMKTSSASSIWVKHLNEIFYASRHAEDKEEEYVWHDFTARLLNIMTPQRLQMSIKTLPSRHWDKVGEILDLAWKRYQFKKQGQTMTSHRNGEKNKANEPRKLNILVMGGSVTMGVFCHNNPVQQTSRFARRNCAWPTRLGHFFNALFDDIVDVHMITLGGTNTESAIRIWDYALFPSDMPHPDIVIHAYSTNDMHVLSENEARQRNVTLEEMILEVNQNFVRTILKPPETCRDLQRPAPLLLYYDDYIGNEQREILKTASFAKAANTVSNYYGFNLMSYADSARHLVYGNTDEDWFSPNNWPERQVHPGMGMHISSIWIVAFNLLNTATSYCSGLGLGSTLGESNVDKDLNIDLSYEYQYKPTSGLPALRFLEKKLDGEPRMLPPGLLPELNKNTSLDNISSHWQTTTSDFDPSACEIQNDSSFMQKPCIFSWVGGLERKFDKPQHLEKRMSTILTSNDGWKASADNNKLGFEATKSNSVFEMIIFLDKKLDVQTLNFMVMTSYGEKWANSKVRVDAFVDKHADRGQNGRENRPDGVPVKSIDIKGFHDRHTSETYNYKLDLGEKERAVQNDTLRVRVTLLGGSTFKFMGMAFCDH